MQIFDVKFQLPSGKCVFSLWNEYNAFENVYIRMKGIQFVVDDTGKKKAVLIDLSEWGEIWEDIYDVLVSQSRKDEPTVSWEELKAEMEEEKPRGG